EASPSKCRASARCLSPSERSVSRQDAVLPFCASRAAARSAFVVPAVAETTTTTCSRPAAFARIAAAASMRLAVPSDVPPNLWITSGRCTVSLLLGSREGGRRPLGFSGNVLFPDEQLRVEHGGPRRAPDRVVRKADEAQAAAGGRPQPADRCRHPSAEVAIEARLRPVGRLEVDERLRRGRGKVEGAPL